METLLKQYSVREVVLVSFSSFARLDADVTSVDSSRLE